MSAMVARILPRSPDLRFRHPAAAAVAAAAAASTSATVPSAISHTMLAVPGLVEAR
jgi:hypothetical protein